MLTNRGEVHEGGAGCAGGEVEEDRPDRRAGQRAGRALRRRPSPKKYTEAQAAEIDKQKALNEQQVAKTEAETKKIKAQGEGRRQRRAQREPDRQRAQAALHRRIVQRGSARRRPRRCGHARPDQVGVAVMFKRYPYTIGLLTVISFVVCVGWLFTTMPACIRSAMASPRSGRSWNARGVRRTVRGGRRMNFRCTRLAAVGDPRIRAARTLHTHRHAARNEGQPVAVVYQFLRLVILCALVLTILRLARRHCDLPSDAAGGDKEQVVNTTSLNDRAAGFSPPAARKRAGSPPVEIRVRWARAKTEGSRSIRPPSTGGRVSVGRDPSPYDRKSVDCGSDGVRAGGLHCRRRPRQRGPAPNEGVL